MPKAVYSAMEGEARVVVSLLPNAKTNMKMYPKNDDLNDNDKNAVPKFTKIIKNSKAQETKKYVFIQERGFK